MSYYQNPFHQEFRGNLLLGDRQHVPTFVVPANAGRGDDLVQSYGVGPFDLSGNDADGNSNSVLVIKFALDADNFSNWGSISYTLTTGAASTSAVTAREVVASLNAAAAFTDRFSASVDAKGTTVLIRSRFPSIRFKFYVVNGRGESVLKFNYKAGVAELPSYFARHTVTNVLSFDDNVNLLVPLDPATYDVDADVINNAVNAKGKSLGLDASTVQADYLLLAGRSGIFTFKKQTVDSSSRVTEIIEYPAGAKVGDLARKTTYTYTGAKTAPDTIAEVPYILASGDLITP